MCENANLLHEGCGQIAGEREMRHRDPVPHTNE